MNTTKKKPGRPRKNPSRRPEPRNGVQSTPTNADNYLEVFYDNPMVFKKIFHFLKSVHIDQIHISFMKTQIIFWCVDHNNVCSIRITVDCNKINSYYCENYFDIGILSRNLELIINTVDKSYNSICLLSSSQNQNNKLNIVLRNDLSIEETHSIELLGEYTQLEENVCKQFDDEDYMIKFRLPGKYFKKMITDIKSFSKSLIIKQDGPQEDLMFEYDKEIDKKIKSLHIVKKPSVIDLKSNLQEDDTFQVSFFVEYVRPISSSLLSEHISIYADENKPLMFTSYMDNKTIEIRVLTKITDNRRPIS
jgi:hypothetical protein